jgi:hypothetical protein
MVRLASYITEAINRLGEGKTPWLRRVISKAAYDELLQVHAPTESEVITEFPVTQVIEAVESMSSVKSLAVFKAELMAIAKKHSGKAKLPRPG